MPVMKQLNLGGTTYDTVGEASVTRVVTSGTKIATITIDGTSSDLYAPSGSSVDPATASPLMDGTAAVGSSAKYAREDHVHPTDTSRQATLVSGTNIKTVNNNSLLGSGNITIDGGTALTTQEIEDAVDEAFPASSDYEVMVSLTNPIGASDFRACNIYAYDGSETGALLGTINSASGNTTVHVSADLSSIAIAFDTNWGLTRGTTTCTGDVTYMGLSSMAEDIFSVSGDGTITIDGNDYSD